MLFNMMRVEFRRLRSEGVKMTRMLVQDMAINLLQDTSTNLSVQEDEEQSGRSLLDLITLYLVDDFLNFEAIVSGKRLVILYFFQAQEDVMNQRMAYFLGEMKRS